MRMLILKQNKNIYCNISQGAIRAGLSNMHIGGPTTRQTWKLLCYLSL